MTLKKLLDMPQVAAVLGCSRVHAWDLAVKGELGPIVDIAKAGSKQTKSRVTEDGVAAYIERRSRSVPTSPAA